MPPPVAQAPTAPPLPLTSAELSTIENYAAKEPELAIVVERAIIQRNRARQEGDEATAGALDATLHALLNRVVRARQAEQHWERCSRDRASLGGVLGDVVSKLPAPPQESSKPRAAKHASEAKAKSGSDQRQKLDEWLRSLAREIESAEADTAGPAQRARLEHARQTLLDATRSATKGMYGHASRLAEQAQALLSQSQPSSGGLDQALRADARRILGERTRLVDSGILVRLAERELEQEDQELVDDLTRLLSVYSEHPVSLVASSKDPIATRLLERVLKRTGSKNRRQRTPDLPPLDGTWIWIGYAS